MLNMSMKGNISGGIPPYMEESIDLVADGSLLLCSEMLLQAIGSSSRLVTSVHGGRI